MDFLRSTTFVIRNQRLASVIGFQWLSPNVFYLALLGCLQGLYYYLFKNGVTKLKLCKNLKLCV